MRLWGSLIPSQAHEIGARGRKPSFPQGRGWLWSHNAPAVTNSMTFTREEPGCPVKGLSLLAEHELGQPWPAPSWGCTPREGQEMPPLGWMSWHAPGPGNEFAVLTHQSCSRTSRAWSCLEGFDGFSCRKMGTTCEQQCRRGLGLIWVSERVEGRKGKCA